MKIIGYARTTINDVDLTSQVEQLSNFGCQEIFHETYESKDAMSDNICLEKVIKKRKNWRTTKNRSKNNQKNPQTLLREKRNDSIDFFKMWRISRNVL